MPRFALTGALPVILIVSSFASASISAQSVAPAESAAVGPRVTEADVLAILTPDHPALAEGLEPVALAQAGVVEASTFEDPVLTVEREDLSGLAETTLWSVAWQLPAASRRPTIQARRSQVEGARVEQRERHLAIRLEVRRLFADWALAAARADLLRSQAADVAKLARREHRRAAQGETSGLSAKRLELAADRLRTRLALARAEVTQSRAKVAAWWPAIPNDAIPVLPEIPPASSIPTDSNPTTHPRVRAAEEALAARRLEQEAARRFVASPEVSLGWQRESEDGVSGDGLVIGLAWSVPLADRKRGDRARSEARVAGAQARLDRVRHEVTAAQVGSRQSYLELLAALDRAQDSLARTEAMLTGAEAAFRLGESPLFDLLDIQRSVTDARLGHLELLRATLAAHRELVRVEGPWDVPVADASPTPPTTRPTSLPSNSLETRP